MNASILRASGLALALAVWGHAETARACGGTFCDTGPTAMPVDQTGENILFVMGDGIVEAHVQIQYQGDPARFAWVVPMQRVPTVAVGSEALFDAVLQASVPSYGYSTTRDQCDTNARGNPFGANDKGFAGQSADGGISGPQVVYRKTVGSFDVAVLEGGTADEVVQWLTTNGYQQSELAPSILKRYVEKGFVFAAVKLTAGAGLDQIHPLVFSYAGGAPCVPLELTAVAAVPDMGVRTFFLGKNRVVPTTYRHVLVNPLKIDWMQFGANYRDVIANAVDAKNADGRAFVTEYAGPSAPARAQFAVPAWNPTMLSSATPDTVVDQLSQAGFGSCYGEPCQWMNPLVGPTLAEFLPPPPGVTDDAYFSCVSCYAGQADRTKWDAAAFAAAIDDRVVKPTAHAAVLLDQNAYLTRMYTLISPDEMIRDPEFREEPSQPDVPLPGLGSLRILCSDRAIFTLPDGRDVYLDQTRTWPRFSDMPYDERVEEFVLSGGPNVLADNTGVIKSELRKYNDEMSGAEGCGCSVPGRRASSDGLAALALAAALGLGRRWNRGEAGRVMRR